MIQSLFYRYILIELFVDHFKRASGNLDIAMMNQQRLIDVTRFRSVSYNYIRACRYSSSFREQEKNEDDDYDVTALATVSADIIYIVRWIDG